MLETGAPVQESTALGPAVPRQKMGALFSQTDGPLLFFREETTKPSDPPPHSVHQKPVKHIGKVGFTILCLQKKRNEGRRSEQAAPLPETGQRKR